MLREISLYSCCTLVLLAGCGDSGPRRVQVEGTVTLDGRPLAGKSLLFIPEPETPGNGASAHTDQDGRYSPTAIVFGATRTYPGIPPGRYRVTVNEPVMLGDAGAAESVEPGEIAPAMGLDDLTPRKSEIPAIYNAAETTLLTIAVPDAGGVIDLELTSARPGRR